MDLFYAIAEPTRRNILEILALYGQLSATEISNKFSISFPAISQHLKVLLAAKLVIMRKDKQRHLYQVNPQTMLNVEEWSKNTRLLWEQRFDALDKLLEAEKATLPFDKLKAS